MSTQIQLRGGTTSQHSTFTGAEREVTVDTDKDTLVVHDGVTAGGHPLVKEGASSLDLNGGDGSGWVIYQSGTDLKFKYNGTDRFKLTSAGALVVEDNVTAYGAA